MDVSEIQQIVLACLEEAELSRVLPSSKYAISGIAAVEGLLPPRVRQKARKNIFLVAFIADYDEYVAVRKCVNALGVWFTPYKIEPFGKTYKFTYFVAATEKF